MAKLRIILEVENDSATIVASGLFEHDTKTVLEYQEALENAAKHKNCFVSGDNTATLNGLSYELFRIGNIWNMRKRQSEADLGSLED